MLDGYRRRVAQIKKDWKIESVPLTSCQLQEIFQMAITQMPPFKGEGTGFQDAVIYRSIIDHAKTGAKVIAAFITKDGDFKPMMNRELENTTMSEMQILPIETILKSLEGRVNQRIHAHWEKERQAVGNLLLAHRDAIEDFLIDKVSPNDLIMGMGVPWTSLRIQEAEVLQIGEIQTAPPPFALDTPDILSRKPDTLVKIGARARVKFTVQVTESPRGLVGMAFLNTSTTSAQDSVFVKSETMERTVDIETTAEIAKDQLSDFQVVSARVNRHPFGTGTLSLADR